MGPATNKKKGYLLQTIVFFLLLMQFSHDQLLHSKIAHQLLPTVPYATSRARPPADPTRHGDSSMEACFPSMKPQRLCCTAAL